MIGDNIFSAGSQEFVLISETNGRMKYLPLSPDMRLEENKDVRATACFATDFIESRVESNSRARLTLTFSFKQERCSDGAMDMTDGCSKPVPKPKRRSVRWTSFVGAASKGLRIRGLQEDGNPEHRVRVEHNQDTMLIHISGEDGQGWTTVALDRATREWAVAQRKRQLDAAQAAYGKLYTTSESLDDDDA